MATYGFDIIEVSSGTGTQSFSNSGGQLSKSIDMTSDEPFIQVLACGKNATTDSTVGDWYCLHGIATAINGSETYTTFAMSEDASGTFNTDESLAESGNITIVDSNGDTYTKVCEFHINSFDSDGFTIDKVTSSRAVKLLVMYGTASNAKAMRWSSGSGTGSIDLTGLGWNPSTPVVFSSTGGYMLFANDPDDYTVHVGRSRNTAWGIGVTDMSSAFSISNLITDGSVYAQASAVNSDSASMYVAWNFSSLTTNLEMTPTSTITDGLRFNRVANANAYSIHALVIEDADAVVSVHTTQAGTGSETFGNGSANGTTPALVIGITDGQAADNTASRTDDTVSIGAYDGTNQSCIGRFYEDKFSSGASVARMRVDTDDFCYVPDGTGAATDQMSATGVDADEITVTHDVNGGAKMLGLVFLGEAAAGGGGGTTGSPWYYYASQQAARGA